MKIGSFFFAKMGFENLCIERTAMKRSLKDICLMSRGVKGGRLSVEQFPGCQQVIYKGCKNELTVQRNLACGENLISRSWRLKRTGM